MGLGISVSVFVKISHPGDKKKATVWKYKVFLFFKNGSKWPCYEEKQIDIIMFRQ